MSFITLLAVALGGAIGAVARFVVHRTMTMWHGAEAAWSTLSVNVIGSFCLGLVVAILAGRPGLAASFWMIGVLGAFTTFSTFAMDAVFLFRDRGIMMAVLYVALSVGLSLGAFLLGWLAPKVFS